jgi:NAD(P)-dependent dehydrogenase (short-subunit alcohol dehydrogenase family)
VPKPVSYKNSAAEGQLLGGKVALITGASQGIGLAIARALAARGCNLIITGRNKSALRQAVRELTRTGMEVLPCLCDVRDAASVDSLAAASEGRFHGIDFLINNAGVAHPNRTVEKLSYESWKEVIDTNLNGLFLVTHSILPLMRRGGAIVNNLSVSAKRVFPGSSAYNASKHGALGFTNTLREELRGKGIRVIALLPGATDTAIWNTLWPEAPRKKMMSVNTVAEAVVNSLLTPTDGTVEELAILPSAGTL